MQKEIKIPYQEFDSPEQLQTEDRILLEKAVSAVKKAYAPYSSFKVGAAVRLANGHIYLGSNQENAAYPSGLCAERVAVFSAMANEPDQEIVSLAITAFSEQGIDHPVAPCGACRQSILEYEHRFKRPIRVILRGSSGNIVVLDGIRQLLPFQFNADELSPDR